MIEEEKLGAFTDEVSKFEEELDYDIKELDLEIKESDEELKVDESASTSKPVLGTILSLILGIVSAILWATIATVTGYSVGYAAIGVGFMVSLGPVITGKGTNNTIGIISGVIAAFSILLGELFIIIVEISSYFEVSLIDVIISVDYIEIVKLVFESTKAIDLLFYFLAISMAYKNSFNKTIQTDIVSEAA